jgi:site-specific DNA-methyltransferase (adenine-specific)
MFCSWHHIDFFKQEFEKYFKLKNIIVWEKNNHGTGDLKGSYAPKYELVLFGEKGRNTNRRKRREDIMKYDKIPSSKLLHPTEKNVSMLEDFILDFSDEKDIILDPFMGSGSTAIACINTNRRYIGFELDKNYYDITNNRIQNILKEGR